MTRSLWFLIAFCLYLLWHRPRIVERRSLSVILPVTPATLSSLDDLLAPLLVYQVVVVCPQSLVADLGAVLPSHPNVSVYPSSDLLHHYQASLEAVSRVNTRWVLLLDEHGLSQVSERDRAHLLRPPTSHLPVGPRGFVGSSQISPSDHAQPAAFLVPPFVAPASLLATAPFTPTPALVWLALGNYVAKSTSASFGGLVFGSICNPRTEIDKPSADSGFFVLAFPHKEDLENFMPAACKLCHQGYTIFAFLYDETGSSDLVNGSDCFVPYFRRSQVYTSLSRWLDLLGFVPDIVIGLDHRDPVSSALPLILEQHPFLNTTLMRLPRAELPYTEWIGTLTLHELRHWNVPEITLSVITNNRPHSLRRLLESIQRTLFYGDKVDLRINMDQTSDPQTMDIVHAFDWFHGDIFLHHRVIHAGLLPAVVESWYPHGDDSYGLLLEDDVELSPLSYAWVKMTLLRYKYGNASSSSSKLFGISLYQQKIIELRPTGRQPFDARTLFRSASLADPSTPYLSQIPCSWGALYFPAPWREFHDYLALRLSQYAFPIAHPIVPDVRSNKWTRSWKKYFVELVHLRGYVMLYPNYRDHASLSTNHLEVGSHVRAAAAADAGAYERKKALFSVPLMQREAALADATATGYGPRLLDLPGGTLPEWERLPVLDLVGELSSLEAIQRRGDQRRAELNACATVASLPLRVRNFLCPVV